MVSTAEAATILGVTPQHISRMARLGEIEAVAKAPGIRGARLFSAEEIEQVRVMRELQAAGKK